jgi:hypothetical protein
MPAEALAVADERTVSETIARVGPEGGAAGVVVAASKLRPEGVNAG